MSFDKCIHLWKHYHSQDPEYFHRPPQVPLFCFPVNHPTHPQPRQLLICLQSPPGRLVISRVSFKWIHTVYFPFCLASFAERWEHYCCWNISISLFPIDKQYSIIWINYILFIHLPIDGHSCCFQSLATMHNAAVCKSLCGHMFSLLLGGQPGAKLLGHMVSSGYV